MSMVNKIHITGAAGAGATTLGKTLAEKLDYLHFDTDDYFWIKTDPPYQKIRPLLKRQSRYKKDLQKNPQWVSSGSSGVWTQFADSYYDLVVFLYVPEDIRIQRLYDREKIRSPDSFIEGTIQNKEFTKFIEWAKGYDTVIDSTRSLHLHNNWLNTLTCPVIRIEGEQTNDERMRIILALIKKLSGGDA